MLHSSAMPSGKTHLRVEAVLFIGWAALGAFLALERGIPWTAVAGFGGGYVASMALLSPDLDLVGSRPFQRWGWLRFVWWPYAKVFRHRRLSHHWLWGPLGRVTYVMLVALAVVLVAAWIAGRPLRVALPDGATAIGAGLGLYLPNATHIALDALGSRWKRRRRHL